MVFFIANARKNCLVWKISKYTVKHEFIPRGCSVLLKKKHSETDLTIVSNNEHFEFKQVF